LQTSCLGGELVLPAVIDRTLTWQRSAGAPVVHDIDLMGPPHDVVLTAGMRGCGATVTNIIRFGEERILIPTLPGVTLSDSRRGV
jgi:hypothetical protein